MKYLKYAVTVAFTASVIFTQSLLASSVNNVQLKMDPNGNSIAVWEFTSDTYDYSIQASTLPAGTTTWSTPDTVVSSVINPRNPRLAINSSGDVALVWTAIDAFWSLNVLYGAFLPFGGSWTAPIQISTTDENLADDYDIRLSDTGDVVLTWSSFSLSTYETNARSALSTFGSWGTPTTISP